MGQVGRAILGPQDPAYPGQRHYTRGFLRVYDLLVLGAFTRWVWRCPSARLVEQYSQHLGARHLDVGPGTGYFLEKAQTPGVVRVTLLDPNPHVLAYASRRLIGLETTMVQADVCKPLPEVGFFDSAAMSFVLHCLPAPMTSKAAAVQHVAAVLGPTGTLFGATVLGSSTEHSWAGRRALRANNRRGIFDNLDDTEQQLRSILDESFQHVDVELEGRIAIFSASSPRRRG